MNEITPTTAAAGEVQDVTFLIVDDDEVCILAIKRVFKQLNLANPVLVANDGQCALDMLKTARNDDTVIPPFLVLLDINMPRMDGFEFLEAVRSDPSLARAVIFILSTSDARTDIEQAYKRNVAGYIVKDDLKDGLLNAISMVESYANVIHLPTSFQN